MVALLNLHYYFAVYTPSRVYGNPTAEVSTELARDLVRAGGSRRVYFFGQPFIYWDFGTLRFLARSIDAVDVPPAGTDGQPTVEAACDARWVFIPERLGELAGVRSRYPGGSERTVYSKADGRMLYVVYDTPAR